MYISRKVTKNLLILTKVFRSANTRSNQPLETAIYFSAVETKAYNQLIS